MQLRPYQSALRDQIFTSWQLGARNVMAVLPTGGGKTVLFDSVLADEPGPRVSIAHRQELVSQMSLTLAKYGVKHRIIGPMDVIRWIIQLQVQELGRDYYDSSSPCAVAGVDTLLSWSKPDSRHHHSIMRWASQVRLWVCDESHHLLTDNKWGSVVSMFSNARGLGVTATPERADGKGLGRHADGLFDVLLEGPGMRDLISMGYLTDYRIFCPPSDLDLRDVGTGADGDYLRKKLGASTRKSSIMGDVITHYLRIAPGKLGVTFAPDVETATELAARFNAAGVPAEVVSAKTPGATRVEVLRRFKRREVMQLVNVDLFGEGFDLPALEVVSMARATQSYGLYAQQFGRSLRILDGKDRAIIIDHVGNVVRHGLPDRPRVWSLDRRERRTSNKQEGVIPLRVCLNPVCMSPYEAIHPACPFCGWVPVPAGRSKPELVDGDLYELDPEVLAAMRGEVDRIDRHPDAVLRAMQAAGQPYPIAKSIANRHGERLDAQAALREAIAWYGGHQESLGRTHRMGWRAFFHEFGVDVLSAQALGRPEAEELTSRINRRIGRAA